MQYEGLRFRAECRLAGKQYSHPFGVDVAFGDPIFGEPETVTATDVLAFAGIAPPVLRLYPIETHIAEKLHAYTMPRARPNSRVKDLPDIALLATIQPLEARRLRMALERTFEFRATHPLPSTLPDPPANWLTPYTEMVRENVSHGRHSHNLAQPSGLFSIRCWLVTAALGALLDGPGSDDTWSRPSITRYRSRATAQPTRWRRSFRSSSRRVSARHFSWTRSPHFYSA
jgi:hypothetical protein